MVVSQTGTNVAKAIKFFTRKPYNHVSLARDAELSEMFSFCRNTPAHPLPATFNQEIVGQGTLGLFSNIPFELYEIPVTPEQKHIFEEQLNHFRQNRQCYSYSVLSICTIFFHIGYNRKNKFVCSQFVAHVLKQCGFALPKPVSLCTPEDLRYIPGATLLYRGELNEYKAGCRRRNFAYKGA